MSCALCVYVLYALHCATAGAVGSDQSASYQQVQPLFVFTTGVCGTGKGGHWGRAVFGARPACGRSLGHSLRGVDFVDVPGGGGGQGQGLALVFIPAVERGGAPPWTPSPLPPQLKQVPGA